MELSEVFLSYLLDTKKLVLLKNKTSLTVLNKYNLEENSHCNDNDKKKYKCNSDKTSP